MNNCKKKTLKRPSIDKSTLTCGPINKTLLNRLNERRYMQINKFSTKKDKTILSRIWTGLKLGWNTPTLPQNIIDFQMNPLIRILRVLGGISTLYLLSNKSSNYNVFFLYLAIFFSVTFFIYNSYISVHRVRFMYRTLKSDKLDIRNSPLDHLARLSARLLLCAKGVCDQAQPVGVAMGIMLGVDTALEKADHKAIFGPILGAALKTMLPKDEQVEKTITDLIKRPVSDIGRNNKDIKELTDIIDSISNWSTTDNTIKSDASEIIKELNRQKADMLKNNSKLSAEVADLLKSNPFNKKYINKICLNITKWTKVKKWLKFTLEL